MEYIQKIYSFEEWCKINGKMPLKSFLKEYMEWTNKTRSNNQRILSKRKKQNEHRK